MLNLEPCFTSVESPESNGMAEAFVKTFKRDYVRITALPGADTALALIENWMEDYNTVHPHSRLGYRSPRRVHRYTIAIRCVSGLIGSTPVRLLRRRRQIADRHVLDHTAAKRADLSHRKTSCLKGLGCEKPTILSDRRRLLRPPLNCRASGFVQSFLRLSCRPLGLLRA